MDIQLADVNLHVDEALDADTRATLQAQLHALDGVVSVSNTEVTPHLILVEYNPAEIEAGLLLETVELAGFHAELIGL